MILTILRLLSLIPTALRLRSELAIENLALRQQFAVLNRRHPHANLWRSDRLFWLLLSRSWAHWKEALVIVKPETVLRWHRKRFASYWTRLSRQNRPGRPRKDREIRDLIRKMADSNPLWEHPGYTVNCWSWGSASRSEPSLGGCPRGPILPRKPGERSWTTISGSSCRWTSSRCRRRHFGSSSF
jgi:hypothetical protein